MDKEQLTFQDAKGKVKKTVVQTNKPSVAQQVAWWGLKNTSSSAIPHQPDRRIGPTRTEAAAIPATVGKGRLAEIVPPATIPVAWRKVWRAVDRSFRSINWNAVVGRLMIAGQETVAMPLVHNVPLSMRGGGECNGGQR